MTKEEFFLEALRILFPAGISVLGTATVFLVLVLFYPEKVEKWQGIIWGWIEGIGILYQRASKGKIRHSIQANVANFA